MAARRKARNTAVQSTFVEEIRAETEKERTADPFYDEPVSLKTASSKELREFRCSAIDPLLDLQREKLVKLLRECVGCVPPLSSLRTEINSALVKSHEAHTPQAAEAAASRMFEVLKEAAGKHGSDLLRKHMSHAGF